MDAAVLFYKTVQYYSVDCRKENPPGKILLRTFPQAVNDIGLRKSLTAGKSFT